jgi:hypothetical protein
MIVSDIEENIPGAVHGSLLPRLSRSAGGCSKTFDHSGTLVQLRKIVLNQTPQLDSNLDWAAGCEKDNLSAVILDPAE